MNSYVFRIPIQKFQNLDKLRCIKNLQKTKNDSKNFRFSLHLIFCPGTVPVPSVPRELGLVPVPSPGIPVSLPIPVYYQKEIRNKLFE